MNITEKAITLGNRYADEKSQKTSFTEIEKAESAEDFSIGYATAFDHVIEIINDYRKQNLSLTDFIIDYTDKYDL